MIDEITLKYSSSLRPKNDFAFPPLIRIIKLKLCRLSCIIIRDSTSLGGKNLEYFISILLRYCSRFSNKKANPSLTRNFLPISLSSTFSLSSSNCLKKSPLENCSNVVPSGTPPPRVHLHRFARSVKSP